MELDNELPDDAVVIARIEIVRYMTVSEQEDSSGDLTLLSAENGHGDHLPLVEGLGLLRLAEDTLIRMSHHRCTDPDDENED